VAEVVRGRAAVFIHPLTAVLALVFFASLAPAQNRNEADRESSELNRLKSQFVEEKQKARDAASAKFDALIKSVAQRTKLKPSERVSLAKKWTDEKGRFLKDEEISPEADLAGIGLQYGLKVSEKYGPLSKKYNDLINVALLRGEMKAADDLRAAKQQFEEQHLPGRRAFVRGAHWEGSRYDGRNAVTIHLWVHELTGDVFKGRAAQNTSVGGHPVYEIQGSIDGLKVKIVSTKQIQGQARALVFDGVILGKTIFLAIGGLSANGQAVNGFAVVSKKEMR
jgi:hypothetical protein